jgi:transposase
VLLISSRRIPGRKTPYPTVVKHFGSAQDSIKVNELKMAAKAYMEASCALEVNKGESEVLRIEGGHDIYSCEVKRVGFDHIYGELFKSIFHDIGLKTKGINILKELVVMRIAKPKSKHYTASISEQFGYHLKIDSIYKLMDRINDKVIKKIKDVAYRNSKCLLRDFGQEVEVLFYDLTTIYFETNNANELREFGFSKDGKHQHVQIMLAMIVSKYGMPVGYEIFQGNTYEGHTLLPTIKSLQELYKIKRFIVVADSGLISKLNIAGLVAAGLEYVIGARIKNSSQAIQNIVFEQDGYSDINNDLRAKVHNLSKHDKLIMYHSTKRSVKDKHDRQSAIEKIKQYVGKTPKGKLRGVLRKSFVVLDKESSIEIDKDKLKAAEKFDGYFALQTNIEGYTAEEIFAQYHGLWQIEQTFRITKSNLRIRPVFHYTPKRIKAHFAICYIALVLIRTLEFRIKQHNCYISTEELHKLLDKVMLVNISLNQGSKYYIYIDLPPKLKLIYKSIKVKDPPRFGKT